MVVYSYNGILHSRRNKLQLVTSALINHGTMFGENSELQNNSYGMIPFI